MIERLYIQKIMTIFVVLTEMVCIIKENGFYVDISCYSERVQYLYWRY